MTDYSDLIARLRAMMPFAEASNRRTISQAVTALEALLGQRQAGGVCSIAALFVDASGQHRLALFLGSCEAEAQAALARSMKDGDTVLRRLIAHVPNPLTNQDGGEKL